LLFSFNAILLLIGLAILGIGIYCQVQEWDVNEEKPTNTTTIQLGNQATTVKPVLDPNTTTIQPGNQTTTTTTVKPVLDPNATKIQPGNQTTTATTVKPVLDPNATDTNAIIDQCKTFDDCVQLIFGAIHSGGLILIIVSAVLIIITVIGMCGASNHNKCLLGIYFAFILILLIAVAIATIWAETTWVDGFKQNIKDNDVIPKEYQDQMDEIIKYINTVSLWALIPLMVVLFLNLVFACCFCTRVKDEGDFGPI